ncbi:LysR substrate-binding domain-containing protein [Neptunomonas phycophila]|uniref:LysR substrate-binding domain-containing protein n=1 Tax=Neptunomonas phycophila TaxID=1572645 RepID=UPI0030B87E3F
MNPWEGVSEFAAVVESGSFTAAAHQLGISTAQVSRQVSALESRLSSKLLYRTTRKVTVTEAGQIYYQHCRPVLDGLKEAEQALNSLQSSPRGRLKITAPGTYGESKIAPLINDFLTLHPDLQIECVFTNQRIDLVEGGYDLAIRVGHLADSSMMATRITSRHLHVCATPSYLKRYGEPHSLSELKHHNCLQGTLDYWRFEVNAKEQTIRISGNLRCNSGQSLLDAALKSIGLVQLPDYYLQAAINNTQLITLLKNY